MPKRLHPAEAGIQQGRSSEAQMPSIAIDMIGGNCPVQAEGRIDGTPFYFRARGSHWSMSIGQDPIGDASWTYERSYGEWPEAGYMTPEEALSYMVVAAESWRRGDPSSADPRDFEAEMEDIVAKSDAAAERFREAAGHRDDSGPE